MDSDLSFVVKLSNWQTQPNMCLPECTDVHTHTQKKPCWRKIRIKNSEVRLNVSSCLFPLISLWQLHNLWTCPSGTLSKQQAGRHHEVTRTWSLQRLAGNKDANSGLGTVSSSSVKEDTVQMMLYIKSHCVCSSNAEMRIAPCTGSYCNCQLTSSGSVQLQTLERTNAES